MNVDPMAAPPRGDLPRIAGYQITGVLGEGGMGRVYAAEQLKLGRPVAIKAFLEGIDPSNPETREMKERFLGEARALALSEGHESIARVYDLVEDGVGNEYIVMERIDGRTLMEMMRERNGPLSLPEAARFIADAADALDHAHRKGVIHRDIKLGNIMVTRENRVKIMDFGLARAATAHALGRKYATKTGSSFGTLSYMSPEQFRDAKNVDARSDIYSLGVCLYRLSTGYMPYGDERAGYDIIVDIMEKPPIPPSQRFPGMPEILEKTILKALAKDPRDRYPTAGAFAAELRGALAKFDGLTVAEPSSGAIKTPSSLKLPPMPVLAGAGAALFLAIVGIGAFVFGGGPTAPPPPRLDLSSFGRTPAAQAVSSGSSALDLQEARSLFLRGRLSEIQTRFANLDASQDSRLADLKRNFELALEAKRLLEARSFDEAALSVSQIDPEFSDANFVSELRDSISWEQDALGRSAWESGRRAYEAGRFGEARRLYAEAYHRKPLEYADGRDLAEAARLAELASAAVEPSKQSILAREYAPVVRLAREAMEGIEAAPDKVRADPKIAYFQRHLGDMYYHAAMENDYREGRGRDALAMSAKINAAYRSSNDLERRINQIKKVVESFEKAEAERSPDIAREVYVMEDSSANFYHRRAKALQEEFATERRKKSQALLEQAATLEREKRLDQAIELIFQARQADPSHEEASERHRDVGQKILDYAKRIYPLEEGAREKKTKLYDLVKRNSLRTDAIYQQAVNQSNELATFTPGQKP
jgi:serine/threonine protein kinase